MTILGYDQNIHIYNLHNYSSDLAALEPFSKHMGRNVTPTTEKLMTLCLSIIGQQTIDIAASHSEQHHK